MTRHPSYKVTFFDRHGPDGAILLRAARFGFYAFCAGLLMFGSVGSLVLGLTGLPYILFTLIGCFTLSGVAMFAALKLGDAAGNIARRGYLGGDASTCDDQFSREQALHSRTRVRS